MFYYKRSIQLCLQHTVQHHRRWHSSTAIPPTFLCVHSNADTLSAAIVDCAQQLISQFDPETRPIHYAQLLVHAGRYGEVVSLASSVRHGLHSRLSTATTITTTPQFLHDCLASRYHPTPLVLGATVQSLLPTTLPPSLDALHTSEHQPAQQNTPTSAAARLAALRATASDHHDAFTRLTRVAQAGMLAAANAAEQRAQRALQHAMEERWWMQGPSVSVLGACLPGVHVHGFHVDTPRLPSLPDATWKHFVHVTRTPRHHDHQGAASTCAHDDNLNALVYAAPQFAPELPLFLQRLTRMLPGMPLMGAVADGSPRGVQHTAPTTLFLGNTAYNQGAVGVLLHGPLTLNPLHWADAPHSAPVAVQLAPSTLHAPPGHTNEKLRNLLQQVLPPEVRHGRKVVVHAAGPHDDGYDEDVATWHVCAVDEAAAQQRFTDMVQACAAETQGRESERKGRESTPASFTDTHKHHDDTHHAPKHMHHDDQHHHQHHHPTNAAMLAITCAHVDAQHAAALQGPMVVQGAQVSGQVVCRGDARVLGSVVGVLRGCC